MATEEPIAPTVVEEAPPATPDTGLAKTKKAKEPKAKKAAAPKKAKAPSAHPTYLEMIGEAISSLKERTGSSQYAIAKFIEDKHKAKLPPNFKKLLLVQLKKLSAAGKLTKVKNSYKLSSAAKKPAAAPAKPKAAAAAKPKAKVKSSAKVAKPKARPAKAAKTAVKDAPAKKAAKPKALAKPKPAKKVAAAVKPKKVKSVKKVGKSPAKKAAPKKAKK